MNNFKTEELPGLFVPLDRQWTLSRMLGYAESEQQQWNGMWDLQESSYRLLKQQQTGYIASTPMTGSILLQ